MLQYRDTDGTETESYSNWVLVHAENWLTVNYSAKLKQVMHYFYLLFSLV